MRAELTFSVLHLIGLVLMSKCLLQSGRVSCNVITWGCNVIT